MTEFYRAFQSPPHHVTSKDIPETSTRAFDQSYRISIYSCTMERNHSNFPVASWRKTLLGGFYPDTKRNIGLSSAIHSNETVRKSPHHQRPFQAGAKIPKGKKNHEEGADKEHHARKSLKVLTPCVTPRKQTSSPYYEIGICPHERGVEAGRHHPSQGCRRSRAENADGEVSETYLFRRRRARIRE